MKSRGRSFFCNQAGSVAVMAALGIAALLGFAALAVDVGHLAAMKGELQRAADAGALAGARALWPANLPIVSGQPDSPDCTAAQSAALSVSTNSNNKVDGAALPSDQVTIQNGIWDYATKTFTPAVGPNSKAVRVTTRATANMFFAQIFGFGAQNISATATALSDIVGSVGSGTLPIAISRYVIVPGNSLFVNFTPDTLDNGAWFTDPPDSASAKNFRDYIDNASCPPLEVGQMINLQNGNDTSVLADLNSHLAIQGGSWDVVLPVVDVSQFVGREPITGFVPFRITNVEQAGPNKGVTGTILGMYMTPNALPGGSSSGAPVLTFPKLL